jgi:hypothetical protein
MDRGGVEITVRGRLTDAAAARFAEAYGDVEVAATVLRAEAVDQPRLQGMIARLQELGCEALEVHRLTRRRSDLPA